MFFREAGYRSRFFTVTEAGLRPLAGCFPKLERSEL
jgi:hypothetical protein